MRNIKTPLIGLATTGLLIFGLSACSMGDESTTASPSAAPTTSSTTEAANPTPLASIASLTGVDTQVAVDAGFLDALTSLNVTPGVVGSATLSPEGVLAFPITGGNVDYYDPAQDYRPYVQGSINHEGSGLSLTAGDKVVELTDFVIDPGTSQLFGTVTVNGEVAAENAFLFNLDGSTLQPLVSNDDGTAVLEGTRVLISEDAAPLLNETFGITDIQPDMLVGIAKITVNTGA
jgi:hypothetical protein